MKNLRANFMLLFDPLHQEYRLSNLSLQKREPRHSPITTTRNPATLDLEARSLKWPHQEHLASHGCQGCIFGRENHYQWNCFLSKGVRQAGQTNTAQILLQKPASCQKMQQPCCLAVQVSVEHTFPACLSELRLHQIFLLPPRDFS